jgi:hypothetical protein
MMKVRQRSFNRNYSIAETQLLPEGSSPHVELHPSTTATKVTLALRAVIAVNGTDYASGVTTITIPAGSTTGTVTVDPTDDYLEGPER